MAQALVDIIKHAWGAPATNALRGTEILREMEIFYEVNQVRDLSIEQDTITKLQGIANEAWKEASVKSVQTQINQGLQHASEPVRWIAARALKVLAKQKMEEADLSRFLSCLDRTVAAAEELILSRVHCTGLYALQKLLWKAQESQMGQILSHTKTWVDRQHPFQRESCMQILKQIPKKVEESRRVQILAYFNEIVVS